MVKGKQKSAKSNKNLTIGIIVAIVVILAVIFLVYRYSGSSESSSSNEVDTSNLTQNQSVSVNTTPPLTPPQPIINRLPVTTSIEIIGSVFTRDNLRLKKGDTVVWTNYDLNEHTITSDSGSELNSASLGRGQTYMHTFNQVGVYRYHCKFHSNMIGSITIEE